MKKTTKKMINDLQANGATLVFIGTGQVESDKKIAGMAGLDYFEKVTYLFSHEGEGFETTKGDTVCEDDLVYEVIA